MPTQTVTCSLCGQANIIPQAAIHPLQKQLREEIDTEVQRTLTRERVKLEAAVAHKTADACAAAIEVFERALDHERRKLQSIVPYLLDLLDPRVRQQTQERVTCMITTWEDLESEKCTLEAHSQEFEKKGLLPRGK